jgi:tRNA U34 5-methylaminomethyl-2-thiouridine-forming methyltransferase MnmC
MHRELQLTNDGSHTLAIPEMGATYHSHHGAIGESRHVYIDAGLQPFLHLHQAQPINILEIGFGTGLNILLTYKEAITHKQIIHYTAIEPFPLTDKEIKSINHGNLLSMQKEFLALHHTVWEKDVSIADFFTLKKMNVSLTDLKAIDNFHCIYFDAFSPTVQPELWTQPVFEKLYQCLLPGGVLVTYCSKSEVRRAMMAAGFTVTKIPGPWGKREMVRAGK